MYKDNTAYLKMIWGNAMTNAGIKFPTVTKSRGELLIYSMKLLLLHDLSHSVYVNIYTR